MNDAIELLIISAFGMFDAAACVWNYSRGKYLLSSIGAAGAWVLMAAFIIKVVRMAT